MSDNDDIDEPEFVPAEWQEEQAEKRRKRKQEFDDGVDSGSHDYA